MAKRLKRPSRIVSRFGQCVSFLVKGYFDDEMLWDIPQEGGFTPKRVVAFV
jgi:hypothetical protein